MVTQSGSLCVWHLSVSDSPWPSLDKNLISVNFASSLHIRIFVENFINVNCSLGQNSLFQYIFQQFGTIVYQVWSCQKSGRQVNFPTNPNCLLCNWAFRYDPDIIFDWCLAVIDLNLQRVEYLDSLGGSNTTCLKVLADYLRYEYQTRYNKLLDLEGWTILCTKDLPRQRNGFDCGVFICPRDAKSGKNVIHTCNIFSP